MVVFSLACSTSTIKGYQGGDKLGVKIGWKVVKKVSICKPIITKMIQCQPACPASWRRTPAITALRTASQNQQDQLDKADNDGRQSKSDQEYILQVPLPRGRRLQPVATPCQLHLVRMVQILFHCNGSRVPFPGVTFHGVEYDLLDLFRQFAV